MPAAVTIPAGDAAERTYAVVAKDTFEPGDVFSARMELVDGQGKVVASDFVVFRTLKTEVLIGAGDPDDYSTADDWVGAGGHNILNFVKVIGPPNTQHTVDLSARVSGSGGVTLSAATVTVTTGASSIGSASFEITGGAESSAPENVTVRAAARAGTSYLTSDETLTVVRFATETATFGDSPVPVNPARVNSRAHLVEGNLFAADTGKPSQSNDPLAPHNTDGPGSGTVAASTRSGVVGPDLSRSKKITPDRIEVTWARHVVQTIPGSGQIRSLARSTEADSGLRVSPPKNGLVPETADNLRVRDEGFPAMFDSASNTKVHYYLGHPTEHANLSLDVEFNHAPKILARPAAEVVLPLRIHLMRHQMPNGTFADHGVGLADVSGAPDSIINQVNTIWSQAGVRFNLVATGFIATTDPKKFDVVNGESDKTTTATFNDPNAIDAYFVNTLYYPGIPLLEPAGYDSGLAVIPSASTTPGVMVAAKLSPTLRGGT